MAREDWGKKKKRAGKKKQTRIPRSRAGKPERTTRSKECLWWGSPPSHMPRNGQRGRMWDEKKRVEKKVRIPGGRRAQEGGRKDKSWFSSG